MKKALTGLLFTCAIAISTVQAQPFSLNDVMSAPFASQLTAARSGGRLAWLEYSEGKRNIWVASAPDWKGIQVTNFTADDGQEISGLTLSPSGDSLLFVRGGDSENGGENPNPGRISQLPSQDVWQVMLNPSPVVKKLAIGRVPSIAPGGDRIAFLRGDEIFIMGADGKDPEPVVHDKGSVSELTWSPDGQTLAFVSARSHHSFIALYSLADKSLRYLDPSVDEDHFPTWSPDGKQLAYIRIPFSDTPGFGPHRADLPWSIRMADIEGGTAKQIFVAASGKGSVFHEIDSRNQILWLKNGRLVFPWERTGWCHLYSLAIAGNAVPVDLTPGEGEVENVSSDGNRMFFSSNIGDLDARHVSIIDSRGTHSVTQEAGVQMNPEPVSNGTAFAYLASNFNTPLHAEIQIADGQNKPLHADALPAQFPARQLQKPQDITLSAADGLRLHAQLFLPPAGAGKHPALVFFHGGSRRQMLPAFHYMFYYSNAYAMNQYLASLGYVVLAVNYRSGIGYGLDFREALNYGVAGGSEYNDVMGAGLFLRSRSDVDPARIGAWGGSYGGYLTAMALARSSDLFAAGVDFHGVHDWSTLRDFYSKSTGGNPERKFLLEQEARTAYESSPIAYVKDWRSPVLLIHGDDDRNVSFSQTEELAGALRQQNVYFEQLIYPNEIHDFLMHRSWVQAYLATADFFRRKL